MCHDLESPFSNKEEEAIELSACSLITSYQLASNGTTRYKMLTSGENSKRLKEYDGQTEVKVCDTNLDYSIERVGLFIEKVELNPLKYQNLVLSGRAQKEFPIKMILSNSVV